MGPVIEVTGNGVGTDGEQMSLGLGISPARVGRILRRSSGEGMASMRAWV